MKLFKSFLSEKISKSKMQKRNSSFEDSRVGFVFNNPSQQKISQRKKFVPSRHSNIKNGMRKMELNVEKPDLTVHDFVTVLSETRNTQGMFDQVGIYCLRHEYPGRFYRLMEAAQLLFGRPYMTRKLFLHLDFMIRKYSLINSETWKEIRLLSYEKLCPKDKKGLYVN